MAESNRQLVDPNVLAALGNLKLKARYVVEGVLTGLHASPHHGASVEFAEHKEYCPGDEIRHIDWKVFGKSDKYYVKQYEDETNLRCYFVLDTSGSMGYGSQSASATLTKFDHAKILAASLSYILLRQQDHVGLIGADDRVCSYLPARGGTAHLENVCGSLEELAASGKTDLEKAFEHVLEVVPRRSVVIVISDFFDPSLDLEFVMRQLVSRRLEVTLLHILDPYEIEFPFQSLTLFKSLETGRQVLAEPAVMRDTYVREMQKFQETVNQACLATDGDYVLVNTAFGPEKNILEILNQKRWRERQAHAV